MACLSTANGSGGAATKGYSRSATKGWRCGASSKSATEGSGARRFFEVNDGGSGGAERGVLEVDDGGEWRTGGAGVLEVDDGEE